LCGREHDSPQLMRKSLGRQHEVSRSPVIFAA